jgi:ornithine cyclodeaminase/alanine dehydrogenase-like protein (mu-crystallin family)
MKDIASEDEINVFTITGISMEDAVTANIAFRKALNQRAGRFIEFILSSLRN